MENERSVGYSLKKQEDLIFVFFNNVCSILYYIEQYINVKFVINSIMTNLDLPKISLIHCVTYFRLTYLAEEYTH